jgi:hypothetical protein
MDVSSVVDVVMNLFFPLRLQVVCVGVEDGLPLAELGHVADDGDRVVDLDAFLLALPFDLVDVDVEDRRDGGFVLDS